MVYTAKKTVIRELQNVKTASGEIVCVYENALKVFANQESYDAFIKEYIAKQEYENTQREMFYFDIKGTRYGYPIYMKRQIVNAINENEKDISVRMSILLQYADFVKAVSAK
jgi:AICAR transformylase/IMP cyclohydrolase PurH